MRYNTLQSTADFNMVVMSSTETSGLTFPPISDVVFVMEETAATALYLTAEMRDNYIVPTLEHFGELIVLFLRFGQVLSVGLEVINSKHAFV